MADQKNHSDTKWEGEGTERDSGPAVVAQPESDTGVSEMVHGNEPSAPPKSWQNPNTGNVCEEPPTGATSGDTYTSTPRNVPTSNPIRTDGQMQTHTRHPSMLPDNTEFKSEADFVSQATVDTPTVPDIEGLVKRNPDKTGIAFLFVCTGSPDSKDYIDNCTAMTKMQVCFEEKLGYLTIPVGMNVTPHQLDLIIAQVEKLELPETYRRSLFYFFGHGNEKSVKFADGYVERQYIISKFQAICPQDSDKVFKIFIFDSCRTGNYITCHAQQETGELSGDKVWKQTGQYPASSNTLVINATQAHCKAFYLVENGCGLMTRFFTELAPTRNESLYDLLVAVRQEIVADQSKKSSDDPGHTQVLVYEDNLMGVVHLLAESRGTARVAPIDVSASPSVCSTNVHWKFDRNVEKEIKSFKVEISPDTCSNDRDAPSSARTKTLSGLESGVTYDVKVVAIYSDGTRAKSTAISFTTPVRSSPSNIAVIPEYPGSPRARVQWSFAGESSDLNCFRVAVQDDEKEIMRTDVAAGSRRAGITGLRPFKTHQVTVIAVYRDDFQTQMNETFTPSDRCSPVDIKVVPDYAGSPNANITWSFMGQSSDISHFRITVETEEGGIVFEDKISKDDRSTTMKKMRPMTKHQVKVIAVYSDGIQNHGSVDFQHEERSYPEKVEVTQSSPGASEAAITWSFPEHISLDNLSCFYVSVKKVGKDRVICCKNVAAMNRRDTIDGLEPATKYAVTVVAHYKDGIVKERATEYETLDRSSPEGIRITQKIPGSGQATIHWSFPENCPALSRFRISVTKEDEGRVIFQQYVTSQERRVTIDSLQPSTKYTVNVVAEKRRIKEHVNCEQKAARNLSARLIRLNTEPKGQPPKVGVEIRWSYERREPLLVVDHFKITATPTDEGKVPVAEQQNDPNRNSVEMKLEPGTTYSLQVVTYFEGNIEPQKSREDKQVHTPTEEQAQLQIENEIIQSKSVSFTILDPPILQNKSEYSADRIQLTAVKYSKREVPHGEDDDEDQYQPETSDNDFIDFKRDSTSDSASPTQPRRVTVDNLTPGRKYKMKLRAEYNTGDVIDSSEINISTAPSARVAPIDVSASPSVRSTNVHWKFDRNVEKEIKSFKVNISPDTCSNDRDAPPSARTKTLFGLESGVTHNVKVVAIYSDTTRSKSTTISFTTPVRNSPSKIAVIPEYPGSPRARVQWSFAGESSDLNCFRVAVQDNEKEIMWIDIAAGSRRAVITGLCPLKTHQVTVIAVYQDEVQTQMNETFTPSDRCSPVDIKVFPEYTGSPNANVTWSFMGQSSDISHFYITVETEEEEIVFEDRIAKDDRSTTLKKMRPMTTHQVKVIAVYLDGIQKHGCVDFQHEVIHKPESSVLETQCEVSTLQGYSLPMIKNYYQLLSTPDAPALPFTYPVEVLTLTSENVTFSNDNDDISISVPAGALPPGNKLNIEVCSAIHGPFVLPKHMRPISPILWICPQVNVVLKKPIKITLPHMIKYEEGTDLTFMKADHKKFSRSTDREDSHFSFEPMKHHEGVEFDERCGSIYTKQFCCICLMQDIKKSSVSNRYFLMRTQDLNWKNKTSFSIDYCIIYGLKTCMQALKKTCKDKCLELEYIHGDFAFNSNRQIKMDHTKEPSSSGWIACFNNKDKISENDVDFWKYDHSLLEELQSLRAYPPKISIQCDGSQATSVCIINVHISGASEDVITDRIILSPPLHNEYRSPWISRGPGKITSKGKEYDSVRQQFEALITGLKASPDRRESLMIKFIQRRWIVPTTTCDEMSLILVALDRIEKDANAFQEFIKMLEDVDGMDIIFKSLTDRSV